MVIMSTSAATITRAQEVAGEVEEGFFMEWPPGSASKTWQAKVPGENLWWKA
jgi:hypothetical protein